MNPIKEAHLRELATFTLDALYFQRGTPRREAAYRALTAEMRGSKLGFKFTEKGAKATAALPGLPGSGGDDPEPNDITEAVERLCAELDISDADSKRYIAAAIVKSRHPQADVRTDSEPGDPDYYDYDTEESKRSRESAPAVRPRLKPWHFTFTPKT